MMQNVKARLEGTFLRYATHRVREQSLPHISDGLLQGQRYQIMAMQDLGAYHNHKHIKSEHVVSKSQSCYHPVGDTYGVLVNQSQTWKHPIPPTDTLGQWGPIETGVAAAPRYTEVRLTEEAQEIYLSDLPRERQTAKADPHGVVSQRLNYDGTLWEEEYLPARIPMLLLNGASGIAVGLAQDWQPVSKQTMMEALKAHLDGGLFTGEIDLAYPSNPIITSTPAEVAEAFKAGRGVIKCQARVVVEKGPSGAPVALVALSAPPRVTMNSIGNAFNEWLADPRNVNNPFSEFRNESTDEEIRLVFKLTRGAIKNNEDLERAKSLLIANARLASTETVNMNALYGHYPRLFGIHDFMDTWIKERCRQIKVVSERDASFLVADERKLRLVRDLAKELRTWPQAVTDALTKPVTDEQLASAIGGIFEGTSFDKDPLTPDDVSYVLSVSLRRLSAMDLEKTEREIEQTLVKIAKLRELAGSEALQKKVIWEQACELVKALPNRVNEYGVPVETKLAKPKATLDGVMAETNGSVDAIAITRLGVLWRLPFKSLRRGMEAVTPATEADPVVSASYVNSAKLTFIDRGDGRVYHIERDRVPVQTPIAAKAMLAQAKVQLKGEPLWVVPLAPEPTHILFVMGSGRYKMSPMEGESPRATYIVPQGTLWAATVNPKHPITTTAAEIQSYSIKGATLHSRKKASGLSVLKQAKLAALQTEFPSKVVDASAVRITGDRLRLEKL